MLLGAPDHDEGMSSHGTGFLRAMTAGEVIGAIVILVSVVIFLWSAAVYGAGGEYAWFPLAGAFATGVTGVGIHAGAVRARERRMGRSSLKR